MTYIMVAVGGFFGAIARYGFAKAFNRSRFPYGTIAVNLLGAFLLGLLYGLNISQTWLLFLGTGFMGAFTTFSTFKIETVELQLKKEWRILVSYILISYGGGLLLAWLGIIIGSR
ncbi:fluoride efflux transporter CrcB [Camelliibacillus cellulosilyticus]|uniref:Fluoride-specific ion channel FluC n=1 Tax=Camelliibacillus cellulosilyticus TaxID=2174486 RepID=A0ABV9GK68_9BACL